MDRKKKGQTLSYSSQLLHSNSSSSQQWQLVPVAPMDSSLQFSQHVQKQSQHTSLRVTRTNQLAAPPGRPGAQLQGVTLPPFSGSTEIWGPLGPSSKCWSFHISISYWKRLPRGCTCVVWLKPPFDPQGSLFTFLVFPYLTNNSLCKVISVKITAVVSWPATVAKSTSLCN